MLASLPNYPRTRDALIENGSAIKFIRLPPNSPQLNLCEYYNRTLRVRATTKRHQRETNDRMNVEFEHGSKISSRLSVLEEIILECIDEIKHANLHTGSVVTLFRFLDKVIAANGYLDMHEPM